jgi:cytochrome c peroxidase
MTLRTAIGACALLLLSACLQGSSEEIPRSALFTDKTGRLGTENLAGPTPTASNPFFQDIGSNGRRCVTCHQAATAWTITPENVQQRFDSTEGADPIFHPSDGAGCPSQDTSTLEAKRSAFKLLLSRALIRVEIPMPAAAEFTVSQNDNPYGCTSTTAISIYRRPLPATNLAFLSMVMWDGRETLDDSSGGARPIHADLEHQALEATLGHAQAKNPPTAAQQAHIVQFESQLYSAQNDDNLAGSLGDECDGGPQKLSGATFFLGMNDPFGRNPTGAPYNPVIFNLYGYWQQDGSHWRASIERGERIFNSRPIVIAGVAGLNDIVGQAVITGTCGTCHDTPNAGSQSLPMPMNIGLSDGGKRTPELPLITLVNSATGAVARVTDPGRALITGKWADIGKFKSPTLRGLAARAPYFHDGSAAGLADVVAFYDQRFTLKMTDQEKADLAAFLGAL